MLLLKQAWKNMWRSRRRTVFTLLILVLGMVFLINLRGISDRTFDKSIDDVAKSGSGHVTVQPTGYLEKPSLKKTVTGTTAMMTAARKLPHVTHVSTRITGNAMIASSRGSQGAGFMAIDPANESLDTFTFLKYLDTSKNKGQGRMLKPGEMRGIVIGSTMAEKLRAKLGSKIVITTTDKQGEMTSTMAKVRGIFNSGIAEIDLAVVVLTLPQARDMLGYAADESTTVAVFVDDRNSAPIVRDQLKASATADTEVMTWDQAQPAVAAIVASKGGGQDVFAMLFWFVVGAGILNSILMGVLERERELGIMLALGMSPKKIFGLVITETMAMGVLGVTIGCVLTLPLYYYLNTTGLDYSFMIGEQGTAMAGVVMEPIMYAGIRPENLIKLIFGSLFVAFVAGAYPAWKAMKTQPLKAIHSRL